VTADFNPYNNARTAKIYIDWAGTVGRDEADAVQALNPQPVPKASLLSPEVFDAGFYLHINPDVRNAFGAGN
jgi:hypothetical protein